MPERRPEPPADQLAPGEERLLDLLLLRAGCGLSPAEADEFAALAATADPTALAELQRTVDVLASVLREEPAEEEKLPGELARRIVSAVDRGAADDVPGVRHALRRWRIAATAGWLAAAASVVLAAGLAWRGGGGPIAPITNPVALVNAQTDVERIPFAPGVDAFRGAGGEVVWSPGLQRGYMRLTGVAANDPTARQYQLWIVDPSRDERPVDGGVFDVASSGEVIVPFESRLPVRTPAAFAITAEKPGGVVVSAGPLLLVAAAQR